MGFSLCYNLNVVTIKHVSSFAVGGAGQSCAGLWSRLYFNANTVERLTEDFNQMEVEI